MPPRKSSAGSWPNSCTARTSAATSAATRSCAQLGASLKQRQDLPLLILPDGTVVNGNRRLAAARRWGIEALNCIVIDAATPPAEYRHIQWRCAVHCEDISAHDKAVAIRDTKADFPALTNKQLADEVLNIDPALVTKNLSLFGCIMEVQEAARAGLIGLTDWYAISKSPDQTKALALALNGSTRDAIEHESRRQRNGNRSEARAVKTAKIKCPLPSGRHVTVAGAEGEEISLEESAETLKDALKLVNAAISKQLTAKSAQSVWRDVAAAGS